MGDGVRRTEGEGRGKRGGGRRKREGEKGEGEESEAGVEGEMRGIRWGKTVGSGR